MASVFILLANSICLAYVGPGPGVSMVGALIGLLLTIVGALIAISLWPIRVLRRRAAERRAARMSDAGASQGLASESAAQPDDATQTAAGPSSRP